MQIRHIQNEKGESSTKASSAKSPLLQEIVAGAILMFETRWYPTLLKPVIQSFTYPPGQLY
ncbi:hypothetical protein HMPREF1981_03311 [Bacteroides pyogenes F0041]|uniref:Uncharacterized protein n=1 Tax=Bacteroides pyogenes F0041 TaxID=1321819 RepID=U2C9R2_9BACE|nr:hypothetical protein HMPREF1981_03311 [Bacteroides pyogenes F0041]